MLCVIFLNVRGTVILVHSSCGTVLGVGKVWMKEFQEILVYTLRERAGEQAYNSQPQSPDLDQRPHLDMPMLGARQLPNACRLNRLLFALMCAH